MHLYAGSNDIDSVAWCKDNSGERTHSVGQKKPNEPVYRRQWQCLGMVLGLNMMPYSEAAVTDLEDP